jgi:hypothetical protein
VRAGDTLVAIARRHGLATWQELYRHPSNAPLRARRPDPDRIMPGDVVQIPRRDGPLGVLPVGTVPVGTVPGGVAPLGIVPVRNLETAGHAQYVRYGQLLPGGRPLRFSLPERRWSGHAPPRDAKRLHACIGFQSYYSAMYMSRIRATELTA